MKRTRTNAGIDEGETEVGPVSPPNPAWKHFFQALIRLMTEGEPMETDPATLKEEDEESMDLGYVSDMDTSDSDSVTDADLKVLQHQFRCLSVEEVEGLRHRFRRLSVE
jgi:hypothetical protein